MSYYYEKNIGGCAIVGIINECGKRFSGKTIMTSIASMRERANGLGGGFAAYGIYPDFSNFYAFHLMYETNEAKKRSEDYLKENFIIEKDEPIPIRKIREIKYRPSFWRYFLIPKKQKEENLSEEDLIAKCVMFININIRGAFIFSSGKNMGIFKGVGFPEDIGRFFRLEEYEGYLWISHGRFPTNSVGWWGGAHPFGLLDWAVVHNGEISSYGITKRYLETFGYHCSLSTDTEVITYLFDLLARKHNLSFEIIGNILATPFWDEIERQPKDKKMLLEALRITYGPALVNGPFSIIVANSHMMVGLNDRIKLRPLVVAKNDGFFYIASEETAIRALSLTPDNIFMPKAGKPIIRRLK